MTAVFQSISFSLTMSIENFSAAIAGALAVARLQHVDDAVLDRELEVLHVLEVLLERLADALQLVRTPSASAVFSSATGSGVRTPATTSSPCALIRNSP